MKNLTYYYQPKYSLDTMSIVSHEALIRKKKNNIVYTPKEIIALASTNIDMSLYLINLLIVNINTINLKRVSFNLSPFVLENHIIDIVNSLSKINYDIIFDIEILESGNIINFDKFNKNLNFLSSQIPNIYISIDDYGNAFSSLERLLYIEHINEVKISSGIFKSLINKEDSLDKLIDFLKLFAPCITIEGIETKNELDLAIGINATHAQGYFLSKPKKII
ncbi:EAL domain-containing protein [Vibrio vulnificus]